MQQCCTGPCLMFCTWKVMLLIGLLKDYGRFNLLTKTGCVFYVSLSICSTVWLYVSCHIPSQIRGEKHSVTRCCQIISLTNVMQLCIELVMWSRWGWFLMLDWRRSFGYAIYKWLMLWGLPLDCLWWNILWLTPLWRYPFLF